MFLRIVRKENKMVADTGDLTKEMGDTTTQWIRDHEQEHQQYGQKETRRPQKTGNNFHYALLAWPKNKRDLG